MNYSRLITTLFVVTCLTSCATKWTKDGVTLQQWHIDHADCEREAAQYFPPQFNTYQSPGYKSPTQTNCVNIGGFLNCNTSGGESYPITVTEDLNERNRHQAWERCIRALGYYTAKERDELISRRKASLEQFKEALAEAKSVSQALCSRLEFASFYKKSSCDEDQLTLEQLSDKSKITEEDKTIVSKLRTERKSALQKVTTIISTFAGKKKNAAEAFFNKYIELMDQNYLKLYQGKNTFGQFNKKRQELSTNFEEEFRLLFAKQ